MSRVDLDRNRQTLSQAFQEVSDPKSSTNWALYGYEGQTSVLKLVSKGDDGLEGLVDELNSGKIMYAYCQVTDPNTGLPKLVLINWQGEGVPELKKGSCANHITDVAKFLKGAHVTINARCDEDVDEDDIMKKVAKSSGANYGFHKEKPQPNANKPSGPVGSVYQKTRPHQEIKSQERDKFWQQQQEDEKKRKEFERQKSVEESMKLNEEVKDREAKEAREREERERERMQKILEIKQAEKRANASNKEADKAEWERKQAELMQDDQERQRRADNLRKQRAQEASSLVGQRENNPRTMFEQKPRSQFDEQPTAKSGPPPPRKLKHGFLQEEQPSEPVGRKQPIQIPRGEPTQAPASPPRTPESPPRAPASPPRAPASPPRAPPHVPEPEPEEPEALYDDVQQVPASSPAPPDVPGSGPHTRNLLAEGLPRRQDSDEEQDEQDWDESSGGQKPTEEDFSLPQSAVMGGGVTQDFYDDIAPSGGQDESPEDLYDDVRAEPPSGPPPDDIYDDVTHTAAEDFSPEMGLVARALYDYQATEDNEITFDPGDLITNIDQIDPGWWVGTTPDGSQGMFPSNYVELLNG